MKIQTELLTELSDAIFDLLSAHPHLIDVYAHGIFSRAQSVKDLNKRFRWDLFYAAALKNVELGDKFREFKDSHIDTALRAIVPPIEDQRGTVLALAFAEGNLTVVECLREIRTRFPAYVVRRAAGRAKVSVTGHRDTEVAKKAYSTVLPYHAGIEADVASGASISRTYKCGDGKRVALRVFTPEGALK